ncbi:MAG TPA: tRNA (adenosine(37)-N6)-threonylcarbamoyltransferase complex dimerization subunit type 1 TsaB [Pyrinomonadaceae bacterium]|jgi:tRNA threonylcarbamoyl adenosine modification protein YeaZ
MSNANITLAIETAVAGGSLSLFRGKTVIDRWAGVNDVSRSEELLASIGEILKRNRLLPVDLSRLAVSLGPGSYTGARIGLSTAIGLKNGLNIECVGTSIFEALFHSSKDEKRELVGALPFGKNEVCFQFCKKEISDNGESADDPKILQFEKFIEQIDKTPNARLITTQKVYARLEGQIGNEIIDAGVHLSDYIGRMILDGKGSKHLRPIYVLSSVNRILLPK